jgi:bla regulator protein blaR1
MIVDALLNGLWQGAFVVAVTSITTLAIPRHHAATRYAVWFAALIALAVVPVATLWHPASNLPLPAPMTFTTAARVTNAAGVRIAPWIITVWLTGTLLLLARLVYGSIRIRGVLQRATPAPGYGAEVVVSEEIALPIAAGFVTRRIVMPAQLLATLDTLDIASILAHERAHVRRGDILGNLMQRCIEAVLWFNPWVYVTGRILVHEREAACDDWAILASRDANRYAACLTRLACNSARTPIPLLTPSAIGSRRMLVGRIARLLTGKVIHVNVNRSLLAATVVLFGLLAFGLQTAGSFAAPEPTENPNLPASCKHDAAVLHAAAPQLPSSMKGSAEGTVLVKISADGRVIGTRMVKSSGNADFDQAIVNAAEASSYSPATLNCKAKDGYYLFHAEANGG